MRSLCGPTGASGLLFKLLLGDPSSFIQSHRMLSRTLLYPLLFSFFPGQSTNRIASADTLSTKLYYDQSGEGHNVKLGQDNTTFHLPNKLHKDVTNNVFTLVFKLKFWAEPGFNQYDTNDKYFRVCNFYVQLCVQKTQY